MSSTNNEKIFLLELKKNHKWVQEKIATKLLKYLIKLESGNWDGIKALIMTRNCTKVLIEIEGNYDSLKKTYLDTKTTSSFNTLSTK